MLLGYLVSVVAIQSIFFINSGVIHIGTELQALKVKMALSCHADYRWIWSDEHQQCLVVRIIRRCCCVISKNQQEIRAPGTNFRFKPVLLSKEHYIFYHCW